MSDLTAYTDDDIWLAATEMKLQAIANPCQICANYLAIHLERLLPHILKQAYEEKIDPDTVVVRFKTNLHNRHLAGNVLI